MKSIMNDKYKLPGKASIWANIDFDKVKNRINAVNCQIEQVIQKYNLPAENGMSNHRNN